MRTFDIVLLVEPQPQLPVEVGRLVVDGVVVRVEALALVDGDPLQEGADLGRVARVVDVPEGAGELKHMIWLSCCSSKKKKKTIFLPGPFQSPWTSFA